MPSTSNPLKRTVRSQIYNATFRYYIPTMGRLLKHYLLKENYQILVVEPSRLVVRLAANARGLVTGVVKAHIAYLKGLTEVLV